MNVINVLFGKIYLYPLYQIVLSLCITLYRYIYYVISTLKLCLEQKKHLTISERVSSLFNMFAINDTFKGVIFDFVGMVCRLVLIILEKKSKPRIRTPTSK